MFNVLHELIDVFEKKNVILWGKNFCGKIKTIVAFTFKVLGTSLTRFVQTQYATICIILQ